MIEVAKIGKSVGVNGGVKLHLLTDFPQIFLEDVVFVAHKGGFKREQIELRIKSYKDGVACFVGYESLELAKSLTNAVLCMSMEDTKRVCPLEEGEAFWFDVIGCEIIEGGECLGRVVEIDRIGSVDYLIISTDGVEAKIDDKDMGGVDGEEGSKSGGKKGDRKRGKRTLSRTFMIPYIPRYVLSYSEGRIYTQDAKEIWLAS